MTRRGGVTQFFTPRSRATPMVEERLSDGTRIAQLVASEVTGHEASLSDLSVADADPDAEPTTDGALAYRVVRGEGGDGEREAAFAEVYVHPDRARVEFRAGQDAAATAADGEGLRVRPKATRPPRTLVFVEDGAEAKRATAVFEAAARAARGD